MSRIKLSINLNDQFTTFFISFKTMINQRDVSFLQVPRMHFLSLNLIEKNITRLFSKRICQVFTIHSFSHRHVSRSLYWNCLPEKSPPATNYHWDNNILCCFPLPSCSPQSRCRVLQTATVDCCFQMTQAAPEIAYRCMHPHLPRGTKAVAFPDDGCALVTYTRLFASFCLENNFLRLIRKCMIVSFEWDVRKLCKVL